MTSSHAVQGSKKNDYRTAVGRRAASAERRQKTQRFRFAHPGLKTLGYALLFIRFTARFRFAHRGLKALDYQRSRRSRAHSGCSSRALTLVVEGERPSAKMS